MIIHIIQTKVLPQDRVNAVNTIKAMMGPTRAKSGCRKCLLLSDVENDDSLLLLEIWDSKGALEDHIKSSQYDLVLETIELGIQMPLLEFHTVESTSDIDYVGSLREAR